MESFFFINKNLIINELCGFLSGGTGSVFTLAGLVLIYLAFLGQKQQLIKQQIDILYNRYEVCATRIELEGQKKQMELQNESLQKQNFELTYFQLLTGLNEIVAALTKSSRSGTTENMHIEKQGRECFRLILDRLQANYNNNQVTDFMIYRKSGVP